MVSFLSTLPARGATAASSRPNAAEAISIHAPREGSDDALDRHVDPEDKFLSTLPARGATGRRDCDRQQPRISIHAPREGSDVDWCAGQSRAMRISIHAPREGSDAPQPGRMAAGQSHFYPRSPRGERLQRQAHFWLVQNFYPRPPRGERRRTCPAPTSAPTFLSTLPARGATECFGQGARIEVFLSTLPARGATVYRGSCLTVSTISIHAPREGSDCRPKRGRWPPRPHFYPRSPRGERHPAALLSGRRLHFYPRSPRGERPADSYPAVYAELFLSTLPARGATCTRAVTSTPRTAFLSTLPARGATPSPAVCRC